MKRNLKIIFTVMSFVFIIYGCEKATIETDPVVIDKNAPVDTVYFQADIVPIFNDNCLGCHSGSHDPNLSSNPYQSLSDGGYINTATPASSELYVKLHDINGSHNGRSTSADQEKILNWIKQGALNN